MGIGCKRQETDTWGTHLRRCTCYITVTVKACVSYLQVLPLPTYLSTSIYLSPTKKKQGQRSRNLTEIIRHTQIQHNQSYQIYLQRCNRWLARTLWGTNWQNGLQIHPSFYILYKIHNTNRQKMVDGSHNQFALMSAAYPMAQGNGSMRN